jgi:hypothetical protein
MLILNKHRHGNPPDATYIGRGSVFGNLKVIGKDGTRDEVIQWYRHWLAEKIIKRDTDIEKAFRELTPDSKLLCFCAPASCHGEVIREYWEFFSTFSTYEDGLTAFVKLINENPKVVTICDYREWLIDKLISGDSEVTEDFRNRELSLSLIPQSFRHLKDIAEKVIIPLYELVTKDGSYSEGITQLAQTNGKLSGYNPLTDGITHINVYSKGKTKLGRSLTNFARIGFTHPRYGMFESIEGFWYWLKTGMIHDELRVLHGFKANEEGKKIEKIDVCDFEQQIKEAIFYKVEQCPALIEALKESTLPFSHYYYYGDPNNCKIIANDNSKWFVDYLELIRLYCKGSVKREELLNSPF